MGGLQAAAQQPIREGRTRTHTAAAAAAHDDACGGA